MIQKDFSYFGLLFYPNSKTDCKKIIKLSLANPLVVPRYGVQLTYLCRFSDGIGTPESSHQPRKKGKMITVKKDGKEYNVNYLQHMVHHSNLENVILNGLLSHNEAYKKGLIKEDISMGEVQQRRKNRNINVKGKTLNTHDFVSLYFNTKNPMMYRRRNIQQELVILLIDTDVLSWEHSIFTDGNAASGNTKFYSGVSQMSNVPFDLIFSGSWNHDDPDTKRENVRKMCSESLIYPSVSIDWVRHIVCPNQNVLNHVNQLKAKYPKKMEHINVQIHTGYFF